MTKGGKPGYILGILLTSQWADPMNLVIYGRYALFAMKEPQT